MYSTVKRVVVGSPLESHLEGEQRLGKPTALAVFASDAISSTAYATQEILVVLVPLAGMAALNYLVPLSLVVIVLLVIVVTSYHQTIHAYPGGGGSYVVARENLGVNPSLVAGASLLVDYTLTVAVSISAGVAAITSAVPSLRGDEVLICVALIVILTLGNLRGVKESGRLFAFPTYGYILTLSALILFGLYRSYTGDLPPLPVNQEQLDVVTENGALLSGVTLFALLRAFSSGAVALTGVEAISNGVSAFKAPESRNAGRTLTWMGLILGTAFLGISVLAHRLQPTLSEDQTVLSIMGRAVFGGSSIVYFALQAFTAAILILAANTAYADFPRLASLMAGDRFLPRQLANRGDRLVFSNGILVLAGGALVLIVAFGGDTSALIPLYAVGVFTAFTLSQSGMVVHHWRLRDPAWKSGVAINATGAVSTFIVLLVVLVSKFTIGAWIPAIVIPVIMVALKAVNRHYSQGRRRPALHAGVDRTDPIPHRRRPRGRRAPGLADGPGLRRAPAPRAPAGGQHRPRPGGGGQPARAVAPVRPDAPPRGGRSPLPGPRTSRPVVPRRARCPQRRGPRHHRDPARVRREPLVRTDLPQPERIGPQSSSAVPTAHGGHLGALPRRGRRPAGPGPSSAGGDEAEEGRDG